MLFHKKKKGGEGGDRPPDIMNIAQLENEKISIIEKEIYETEKKLLDKYINCIKETLHNDERREKIVQAALKEIKKDGHHGSEEELDNLAYDLWDVFSSEYEYVSGYADEYVELIKDKFFASKGLSRKKIVNYLIEAFYQ